MAPVHLLDGVRKPILGPRVDNDDRSSLTVIRQTGNDFHHGSTDPGSSTDLCCVKTQIWLETTASQRVGQSGMHVNDHVMTHR